MCGQMSRTGTDGVLCAVLGYLWIWGKAGRDVWIHSNVDTNIEVQVHYVGTSSEETQGT